MKIRSNLDVSKTITSASFASRVQTVSGASGTVEVDATLGSIIDITTIDETVLTIINPIAGVTYTLNITGSLTFEGVAYADTVLKADYDGSWNVLIGEAPKDGTSYARKDGGWVAVESEDIPSIENIVTVDADQEITGKKTFKGGIEMSSDEDSRIIGLLEPVQDTEPVRKKDIEVIDGGVVPRTPAKYFPLGNTATNPVSSYYTAHEYEFIPNDGLYFNEPPTDFTNLFRGSHINDSDLSLWDTSNVTNMYEMFSQTTAFNQDISSWDVSKVTNMSYMFYGATAFNQDINSWDVSNVTDMNGMFSVTTEFNGDISSWDVSNVTDMGGMFSGATSFNQDLSSWDVSSLTDMSMMFYLATAFNQDLSQWCVSNFSSTPYDFDNGANAWVLPRPVWGTCPRGEDQL